MHARAAWFTFKSETPNLLESVLQDLEGLGQVPRLSPGPRREQRAAGGQRQSHQGQGSPDDPQLAHSPPLQNPLHVCCTPLGRSLTRRRRPSEIHALTPFQQSLKVHSNAFQSKASHLFVERAALALFFCHCLVEEQICSFLYFFLLLFFFFS